MTTTRAVAYNTVTQAGGKLASAALALVSLRVSVTYLGPHQYGAAVTATAFVTLFGTLSDWGLTTIAGREIARTPGDAADIIGANLAMRLSAALVAVPVIVGLGLVVYAGSDPKVRLGIALLSLTVALSAVQSTMSAMFVARARNDITSAVDVLARAATLAAVLVVARGNYGYEGYLIANLAVAVAAAFAVWAIARRHVRVHLIRRWSLWRRYFLIAAPLGLVQMVNVLYYKIDSVLLSLMRDTTQVGYYGVAYRVIDVVMSVPGFFMLALMPTLARAERARLRHLVQRALDSLVMLGVPVLALGIPLAPGVVRLLAGARFDAVVAPLVILLFGASFSYVNGVFGNALVAVDKQRALVWLSVGVTALNVVLNLALIPPLGTAGAALATSVSEAASMFVVSRLFVRETELVVRYGHLWKPVVAGAGAVSVWGLERLGGLPARPQAFILAMTLASMALVYAGLLVLLRAVAPRDLWSSLGLFGGESSPSR